ncbi:DUF262 domain-containing protein [Clostridium estertheticum]|uniref:DUF262 domain-containing protein n=1 Tax=Clostridium estertheticum TaxID=238834 RepID=UPI001C7E05FF|nr:DUF262 domain-containing protein [Clostridium estertheticum]MBX4263767.1 DUF262 domain-containing protein [Clostridium estertheticum]WLC87581.1 DUF262 domain-containing protein [Clostridium estertheticum]
MKEKYLKDLDKIVEIARLQDYKINSITFYNLFSSFPDSEKSEEILDEMEQYLKVNKIDIVTDGVELEELDNSSFSEKIRPFDPSKIDIIMKPMTMDSLLKRIGHEEINLNTDFQRKGGLWTDVKKSQLIESLLLKIPLPAFYFDAGNDESWLIIDGLQRITAFKEFIVDKTLPLVGLEFFSDFNGLTYDNLPRTFTRRIEETNIIVYTLNPGTPQNVKYNIFKRINTGGLQLEAQEIRHALYQGASTILIKEMASMQSFLEATSNSIKTDRMMDREFALRFISVCFYGIEKYEGNSDEFLNNTMVYINNISDVERKTIKIEFDKTMIRVNKIFGRYSFRKMGRDYRRRPINKAVFEIWCYNLMKLNENQIEHLMNNSNKIYKDFIDLCEIGYSFSNYLKASDKKSFLVRIRYVERLIKEILGYDK